MKVNIGSQLVSKLGSPDSKIPLLVKDAFNSAGYTYFSYDAGGSVEGADRLVDEVGTGAIWLFGIPLYKKLIDKTIYKKAGISPEVDVRIVKDKSYLKEAIENAPTKEILNDLQTAGKFTGKTKNLALAKFVLSMGLTMLSYFGLTKLKQNMTRLNIEKEFNERMKNTPQYTETKQDGIVKGQSPVFSDFDYYGNSKSKKSNPSFGASAPMRLAEEFMLNPVNNMILLDLGISGSRLANARTDGELKEYAIKEGSFLFFVYGAGNLIRKGLDYVSRKVLKLPVALDAKFLASDLAENVLKDENMQQEVKNFAQNFKNNGQNGGLYNFIFKNQNNAVVNAAKESGIIETVKDNAGNVKIDTRKYIDPKKIDELVQNLKDFIEAGKKSTDIQKYLNKVKGLKIVTTAVNIGICCLSLGYIVPKYIYKYRQEHQNGNSEFHVKAEYEKELAQKYAKLQA